MFRSSQRSRLWGLAPLAVLLFTGWQMVAVLSRTPAFNAWLQVEAPENRRIPQYTNAFYDRAAYRYRTARLWFNQARYALQAVETEGIAEEDATGAPEVPAETAARAAAAMGAARTNARESLTFNPGDPDTWLLLARTELAGGNLAAALDAYRTCYARATHNAVLAAERVGFLISFMAEPRGWDLALANVDPADVRADLDTMRIRMGVLLKLYAEAPAILALIGETPGNG